MKNMAAAFLSLGFTALNYNLILHDKHPSGWLWLGAVIAFVIAVTTTSAQSAWGEEEE